MNIVDDIFTLFAQRGSAAYFGETISQLEHALQTAYQADQDHAPDHVIVVHRNTFPSVRKGGPSVSSI